MAYPFLLMSHKLRMFVKENLGRKKNSWKILGEHSTTEDYTEIALRKLKQLLSE